MPWTSAMQIESTAILACQTNGIFTTPRCDRKGIKAVARNIQIVMMPR